MNNYIKELKIFLGSFRFNWKQLFLANVIDIREDDEKRQKEKRVANIFFACVFGLVALLAMLNYAPNVRSMTSSFLLVGFIYIGFCAIMNSLRIKKNNSGRKSKTRIGAFPELFFSPSDFNTVDCFVRSHYSPKKMMSTSDCHCLLEILIDKQLVRDKALDPMVTLFVKQYPDLLHPKISNRAITKAKIYDGQKPLMTEELFQNSSKKQPFQ